MVTYPSREEAQAMIDWLDGINRVNTGLAGISDQLQEAFKKAESARRGEWDRIFGDNSPWRVVANRNSYSLKWDEDKANRLNIT